MTVRMAKELARLLIRNPDVAAMMSEALASHREAEEGEVERRPAWITVHKVAEMLEVSGSWVRQHAGIFRSVKTIGTGRYARRMFRSDEVMDDYNNYLTSLFVECNK